MDELRLIDALYGLVLLLIGGLVQTFRDQLKQLRTDTDTDRKEQWAAHAELQVTMNERDTAIAAQIAALRDDVSRNYTPRAEMAAMISELKAMLLRIEHKLDGKADKR